MNNCGPNYLHGLRYSIGLEFSQVVGAKVHAEADGLASYPPAAGADGMYFGTGNNQGHKFRVES